MNLLIGTIYFDFNFNETWDVLRMQKTNVKRSQISSFPPLPPRASTCQEDPYLSLLDPFKHI